MSTAAISRRLQFGGQRLRVDLPHCARADRRRAADSVRADQAGGGYHEVLSTSRWCGAEHNEEARRELGEDAARGAPRRALQLFATSLAPPAPPPAPIVSPPPPPRALPPCRGYVADPPVNVRVHVQLMEGVVAVASQPARGEGRDIQRTRLVPRGALVGRHVLIGERAAAKDTVDADAATVVDPALKANGV